ncbi:MAG: GNAT family N-acetyltransferase [Anaerosomatales bacterium]|nr:GNAT family N-acetyltransferase [Anaerosomatales bacterium]MDT8434837.1 GNAT family N-acetyltransferase [Anaerosomatales bacterium]
MDETFRIRRLERGDDRTALRSGDARLDEFLRRYAAQNQFRHHLGVTYVAVDEPTRVVVGYVTLSAASLAVETLPAGQTVSSAYSEVPVLRVARLAVDERVQGSGLGSELLRYALDLACVQAASVGCVGVVVDAKPEAVGFYSRYGFVPCRALQGGATARPRQELLFLALSAVEAALD